MTESNEGSNYDTLISVVIPVYKVESYLSRCIDSVLSQTYPNIDVILVNDGSPDNCGTICDDYARKDDRIKVIHKENEGLSAARNTGIEAATGEYITFIDSDDWVHESYLDTLYTNLVKNGADLSACEFRKVTEQVSDLDLYNKPTIYSYSNVEALGQFVGEYYTQMVVACGKLYKKSLFENVSFPKGKLHEDEFTTYKLIYNSTKISFTTEPLYYYFQRPDSIIGAGYSLQKRLDVLESYEERADFFETIGLSDLARETYRRFFLRGFGVVLQSDWLADEPAAREFEQNFKGLKAKLRRYKYSIKFKAFYEIYYLNPNLACWVVDKISRMRKVESG